MDIININRFNLDTVKNIKQNNISYTLPENTKILIKTLFAQVGSPEYQKTPNFSSKPKKNRKRNNIKEIDDAEWTTIRTFQKTNIDKQADELELLIDNIRNKINKLTDNNYNTIKLEIFEDINQINDIDCTNKENGIKEIWNSMYAIFSFNNFYVEIYVKIINDFITLFPEIKNYCLKEYENFIDNMDKLNIIITEGIELSYDELCNNNIESQKRKNLSALFIKMTKYNIIEEDDMFDFIDGLMDKMIEMTADIKNIDTCNEMTNILCILITDGLFLKDIDIITSRIKKIINMDKKKNKGLSSKSKFAFMDLITLINKNN
jgi:hypothetical protein